MLSDERRGLLHAGHPVILGAQTLDVVGARPFSEGPLEELCKNRKTGILPPERLYSCPGSSVHLNPPRWFCWAAS